MFVHLPANFKGSIKSNGKEFRGIIIQGVVAYQMPNEAKANNLDAGSYFTSEGNSVHTISTNTNALIYVRTNRNFTVSSK